jgi:hypothetical protein
MIETDSSALVDISTVAVDRALPDRDRCVEYKRQIKDSGKYIAGNFSIVAIHPPDGESLESCLRALMS